MASSEAGKWRVELQEDSDIYLKLAKKNEKQAGYTRLDAAQRWWLLTPAGKTNIGAFWFEAFLYVQNMAPSPGNFHRAAQGRVNQARLQRIAHEATNAVHLWPYYSTSFGHCECPPSWQYSLRGPDGQNDSTGTYLTGNVLHSMLTSLLETITETGEQLQC
ncbi:hypothetical protein GN958_ATG20183 [Phytophthora infestans]|uniref:Uncharacterized protein n=1 Tax=Phytophthora infestans TaxID=4787 RepID=A0A8S9TPU2_PHYIN|nr:hypothetical protein GN958_ATG20183 [Phytophthora infestans]